MREMNNFLGAFESKKYFRRLPRYISWSLKYIQIMKVITRHQWTIIKLSIFDLSKSKVIVVLKAECGSTDYNV